MAQATLAPKATWYFKGNSGIKRTSLTEIDIVDTYQPTGAEVVSWDASEDNDRSVTAYVVGTKLIIAGNGSGCIYANLDSEYMFSSTKDEAPPDNPDARDYFDNVVVINGLELLNMSKATTLKAAFRYMKKLASFTGVANWDVSNVTSIRGIWCGCISLLSLTEVNNWNTSSFTDISVMLQGAASWASDMKLEELNIEDWDVSNVTDAGWMFYGCAKIQRLDLSKWNTRNFTSLDHSFCDMNSLRHLNLVGWDTRNVRTFRAMFNDCTTIEELDLSTFDTSNAMTLNQMFERCVSLKRIKGLRNFTNVSFVNADQGLSSSEYSELSEMFLSCAMLKEIDLSGFTTPFINSAASMFDGCRSLERIYVSPWWVENLNIKWPTKMFQNCVKLVGGSGTAFDANKIDSEYARIDNGLEAPGYFTISRFANLDLTPHNGEFPSTANGISRPATEEEIRLAESSGYTHPDLFRTVIQPEDGSAHYTLGVFNNEAVLMVSHPVVENDPREIP